MQDRWIGCLDTSGSAGTATSVIFAEGRARKLGMEDALLFTLSKELTLFPQRLGCVEGTSQVEGEEQPPSVV